MNYDKRHSTDTRVASVPVSTEVLADDGRSLFVTTFEPRGHAVGAVIIASAMATPASFYSSFASHLAERGLRTLTFDYRTATGTPDEMRHEDADVDRWAADAAAVLDWAANAADGDGVPITWIGHSLGGQIIPFVDHGRLAAIINIAAGDGYWRRNAPGLRWRVPFLWWVMAPVAMAVTGYFPGRRLGLGGDLPSGVLRQWSRWCRHPEYLRLDHPDATGLFDAVKTPLMTLSFTDDEVLSAASVAYLHSLYRNAEQVRQRFSPAQLEVDRMGHHGFFRRQHHALWDELVVPWIPTTAAR